MKRSIIAALVLALAACATQPLPPPPPADQFEASAGQAFQQITLARQALTELAKAGKITWAQDDLGQSMLSSLRKRIEEARTLRLTDPVQASRLLSDALNELAKYQEGKQP